MPPFSTEPVVTVEDAGGRSVATDSSQVTLSITAGTGTAGAVLNCTTNPLGATSGVASFAGCQISKAGTGYTLTASDASLAQATSASFSIAGTPPASTAAPTVSGIPTERQVLIAGPGTWSGTAPIGFTYSWQRCTGPSCADIIGAIGSTYKLVSADVGVTVRVIVQATNSAGSATANSAQSGVISAAPPEGPYGTAVLADSPEAFWRLRETAGASALADETGLHTGTPTSISFGVTTPLESEPTDTAISLSGNGYFDTPASTNFKGNSGFSVEAWVYPTANGFLTIASNRISSETGWFVGLYTGSTQLEALFPPYFSISSNALPQSQWSYVAAVYDPSGLTKVRLYLNGTETGYSYRDASWGTGLTDSGPVRVGQTPDGSQGWQGRLDEVALYNGVLSASRVTAHWNAAASPPANISSPSISGPPGENQVLNASTGTWSGSPTGYTYQWRRCDSSGASCVDIGGASAASYTLTSTDVGSTIRVSVTASNRAGSATASSAQTAIIVSAPANTTLPAISGAAQDGEALTVTNGTWTNSPTSFAYQWRRCDSSGTGCVDITNAQSATYTIASADVGATIRAVVTASNVGGSTSATSPPTAVVAGVAPTMSAAPTISGVYEEGRTLSATNGTWSGTTPMAYAYSWQRCVGGACTDIPGATANSYTLTGADVAATVRVIVQATNAGGSASGNHESSSVASPSVTPLPYRDPAYADELWTLLVAHWPNAFSNAEQALGQSAADVRIKTGLWKARTAAGVLPDLGWAALTHGSDPWTMGWKITRSTGDTKWVHFAGDPGFSGFVANSTFNYVDNVRWQHWCPTAEHPDCAGGYYSGIDHPQWIMDFHRNGYGGPPNNGWHIGRFPDMSNMQDSDCYYQYMDYVCAWGSSPDDLAWNHHLWDFNSTSTVAGTLTPFGAATGKCGISSYDVLCFTRSLSDAQMAAQIQVDDFADFSSQSPDATWPSTESGNSWPVPTSPNLEPARAVLDTELPARDWVDRQLTAKPSLLTAPLVSGFANQGETLIGTHGDWNYAVSYSVHWLRCDASGAACVDLYGATSYAYPLTAADVGSTLRFKVTASNAAGSATAISDPSALVLAPIPQLATSYRPALLFDSGEHYRPITVDSLLAERNSNGDPVHRRCDTISTVAGLYTSCGAVGSIADLVAPGPPDTLFTNLSIWPYNADSSAYRSPSCASDAFLRDCGNSPAIYYDYGQSAHGYRFIDYWLFYRYNPFAHDDHEGDWEGLTVQLDSRPDLNPPITGIILAQHNKLRFRLAYAFEWCPNGAPSQAACSYGEPPATSSSAHAATFVAEGSHSSYEDLCTSDCPNPATDLFFEHSHDGASGWTYNSDASCAADSCVRSFDGNWVSWDGRWGGSGNLGGHELGVGDSPDSPGARAGGRYACTQVGWACQTVPDGSALPLSSGHRSPTRGSVASELRLEKSCSTWMDATLAAGACSGAQLRQTLARHRLSKHGSFSLAISGRRSATAPGLVQVVGRLLRPGATIHLSGLPAKDEVVILNCLVKGREFQLRLSSLRLRKRAAATVQLIDGQPRALLTRMKAQVRLSTVGRFRQPPRQH